AVLKVRFVGQARELRQFAGLDDRADGVFELALVDPVRDGSDDDLAPPSLLFQLPFPLHLDAARPFLVDLAQGRAIGDDLTAGGGSGGSCAVREGGGPWPRVCRAAPPPL